VVAPLAPLLTRTAPARRLLAGQMILHGERLSAEELTGVLRDLAAARGFDDTRGPLTRYRFPDGVSFDCPVTVAWGSHDFLLLTRPQAERARRRLPQARHVTLDGCGHIPTWDDPAQVAQVILETTGAV
jgi:pimeloyl-ACP methyl ester carboxylesterase